MNTAGMAGSLGTLFRELVLGAPLTASYVLNRGDAGLLRSLDGLSAASASVVGASGSSVAAHAEHLRYGLSLLNDWAAGVRPLEDADWTKAWRRTEVSEVEWSELRRRLRDQAEQWLTVLESPREVGELELNDVIGSIAHIAYHLGAMRQINQGLRGPAATDPLVSKP
jgi:hypothetical protein